MATQRTKFTVGLFVASGIGIAVFAFIWLGMSRFLEKGQFYVAYFNESVQGLDIDSPVKYRGVSIGRVERIEVAPDSRLIQVILKIETDQPLDTSIVAQLKSVGITGSMFVDLDRRKKGEPDRSPRITFPTEYPILASRPSNISELLKRLSDMIDHIKSIDLSGISDKIKRVLDNATQLIADVDMKEISGNVNSSLVRVRQILDNEKIDSILVAIEDASQSLSPLLDEAKEALDQVDTILERVDGIVLENRDEIEAAIKGLKQAMENANTLLKKGSVFVSRTDETRAILKKHLLVIGQNMERATENLNILLDLLADHPSQLLFGEPYPPREIKQEGPGK